MSRHSMMGLALLVIMAAAAGLLSPAVARADDRAAEAALKTLYKNTPEAKTLEDSAKGILVFPNIKKAGFVVGAQYGTGTLFEGGRPAGHYRITAGSYGLQAGVQGFSYAMFFMTDDALKYLDNAAGFEIGVGPSVVVVDAGKAKTLTTTTTARADVYAFIYGARRGSWRGWGCRARRSRRPVPSRPLERETVSSASGALGL